MRFGETDIKWSQRVAHWRVWFAWYPVKLADGSWLWLDYVQRKDRFDGGYKASRWCFWSYRSL
ncbi:hypothetical protein [Methylobacterium marchantiae]|uniref:Transposase n=1 Tax=Methylobacterium marchantiae TaxID=600331 RepID=A0ABW3X3L6_9HYPH|nr:hypothetical protein AIGOOFII_3503 [Methylobacterium marchantiae]